MYSLVLVESPAKVKKIQSYLGKAYLVKATFGHCYQIDPKETSIDIGNNFEPKYVMDPKKVKVVKEIQEAAKGCDMVYIASDPDREGEAIGWHIAKFVIKDDSKIKRVTFHEITKSAILNAFKNVTTLSAPIYHSQQARAVLDRLVGYEVSPVLWRKVCKGTSAGRVQSIGLRLIVDRQNEIDTFVPEEYWNIFGDFKTVKNEKFRASYISSEKMANKAIVDGILKKINDEHEWKIHSVEKSIKLRKPSPVFNTSSLQQFAGNSFGWPGKKTMSVAQKLYEAGLCVLPEELVVNSKGGVLTIEEAVNRGESKLIGFDKFSEGCDFLTGPTDVYAHQKIPYDGVIRRIRTIDGQELGCTPDHEIMSWGSPAFGYKAASSLKKGEFVLCAKKMRGIVRGGGFKHLYFLISKVFSTQEKKKILVDLRDEKLVLKILYSNKSALKESTYYKYRKNNRIPFLMFQEYLDSISSGDWLSIVEKEIAYFLWATPSSKPEMFSLEDFLYFLGACLGDGHISMSKVVFPRCIATDDVWSSILSCFGRSMSLKGTNVRFSGQILRRLCIKLGGMEGNKTPHIYIHPIISEMGIELLKHFIAGLLDTDGCINFKHNLQISYTTISRMFAKQLNVLFRSLGYLSGIHHRLDDYKNCSVNITRRDALRLLKGLLPYLRMTKKFCEENISDISVGNTQKINFPVIKLVEKLRVEKGITKEQISQEIFGNSSSYWNYISKKTGRNRESYLNPEVLGRIASYLNDAVLKKIANGDAYFTEIKEICDEKYSGYVYDVSTSTENFLCNTFYVHNCTYHRTDSLNISKEALDEVRQYIGAAFGSNYLPATPNYFKSKNKSAQEAHEGIRCTNIQDSPSALSSQLSKDEFKLYEAIYFKFLSCQMSEAKLDHVKVIVGAKNESLKFGATGQRIVFDGFLKAWPYGSSKDEYLPEMIEGEKTTLLDVIPEQHFTKPSASFNDASLVKVLEENGVGRPSTYASIIDTLEHRTYVEREGKSFRPTELGKLVCNYLVGSFPELMNTGYTARIEEKLDEIAEDKHTWYNIVSKFYEELDSRIKGAREGESKKQHEVTGITCPLCGVHKLVKMRSKYGEFYGCEGYMLKGKEKCKASFSIGEDGQPVAKKEKEYLPGIVCDRCGKKVIIRISSKTGKKFGGCSGFPKCKRMFDMDGNPIEFKSRYVKKS